MDKRKTKKELDLEAKKRQRRKRIKDLKKSNAIKNAMKKRSKTDKQKASKKAWITRRKRYGKKGRLR